MSSLLFSSPRKLRDSRSTCFWTLFRYLSKTFFLSVTSWVSAISFFFSKICRSLLRSRTHSLSVFFFSKLSFLSSFILLAASSLIISIRFFSSSSRRIALCSSLSFAIFVSALRRSRR